MKSYQHLLNAMAGLCAALIGVRLILPAILEIPGFISLLTDETIPQPWEIFKFYLSSGMPIMELSLLAGGILCLLWFVKRRSGAFVQWASLLAAIGYLFLPFTILINGGGPLLALFFRPPPHLSGPVAPVRGGLEKISQDRRGPGRSTHGPSLSLFPRIPALESDSSRKMISHRFPLWLSAQPGAPLELFFPGTCLQTAGATADHRPIPDERTAPPDF